MTSLLISAPPAQSPWPPGPSWARAVEEWLWLWIIRTTAARTSAVTQMRWTWQYNLFVDFHYFMNFYLRNYWSEVTKDDKGLNTETNGDQLSLIKFIMFMFDMYIIFMLHHEYTYFWIRVYKKSIITSSVLMKSFKWVMQTWNVKFTQLWIKSNSEQSVSFESTPNKMQ